MSIDNSHKISDVKVMLKVGADGAGITNIEKTGTAGLVDTYTITLSTGAKYTFPVTNGKGISNIAKTSTTGLVDTYTITYNDGTTSPFYITNGNGITNIAKTSTAGLVDTYTIYLADGTTTAFTVTNGVSGGMSAKIVIKATTGATVTLTDPSGASIPIVQVAGTTDEWEGETTVYGTHTASSAYSGGTKTQTVDVDACKIFNIIINNAPDGSTVTPTDDVQIWLNCADIWDKSYTTLNEVLSDSTTLASLMADNNAVDYLVRSTTWASGITGNALAMHDIGINNYCADTLLADSTWESAIASSSHASNVYNISVQNKQREDVPANITKKTFATATDAEINEMCKWSERGVIDLETDCGWTVGQEHTFTLGAIATTGTYNGTTWTVGESQPQQSVTLVLTRKGGAELVSPVLNTDGTSRNTPAFEWDYKDCLGTKGYMNSTDTNVGSWGASARRSWCNSGLLQQMLAVLPKLCNLFKVITAKTYNGSENEITNDYIALRAQKEVLGTTGYSNSTEAGALTQATYYETSANRIKSVGGEASQWWNRSPRLYNATTSNWFCFIEPNGNASGYNASSNFGIAPFGTLG